MMISTLLLVLLILLCVVVAVCIFRSKLFNGSNAPVDVRSRLLNNMYTTCDINETCCAATAECVYKHLTGENVSIATLDEHFEITGPEFLNPDLISKPETKRFLEVFWSKTSSKPTHTAYILTIEGAMHNLVIEKYTTTDPEDAYWRIFQGWKGRYTLWNWLGIKPYEPKDVYADLMDKYGKFKKLTKEQLMAAFKHEDLTDEDFTDDVPGEMIDLAGRVKPII